MSPWQATSDRMRAGLRFAGTTLLIGPAAFGLASSALSGFMIPWAIAVRNYFIIVAHFACYILIFFPAIAWFRARPPMHLAARAIVCVSLAGVASAVSVVLCWWSGLDPRSMRDVFPRWLTYGLVFAPILLLMEHIWDSLGEARRESEMHTLARERERRAAAEARWNSLESRLHPHFVFNTLASIRELLHQDPRRADLMIQRFAELLRFSLDAPQNPLVLLEEELRMVTGYLEIEQMRLGSRLTWSVKADQAARGVRVPSLCLLTLVENSIKHAVSARRVGGRVSVAANCDGEILRLEVTDDGPGFAGSDLPAGHGLNLLRERLLLVYGGGATFRVTPRHPGVVVEILLPAVVQELTPNA